MSSISAQDARGLFTKTLVDVYRERIRPTEFLRSFFPKKQSFTKEISIEVERGFEKVAVDVSRGTNGNRNQFTKSTEKIFVPPYYREFLDATEIDLYDRLFGSTSIEAGVMTQFTQVLAERLGMLQDKIDRAYELQCSQVLTSGIVTLNQGVNIDFKRKALSLVDLGAGNYWAAAADPNTSIEAGCNFLRQKGKFAGAVVNMIMGSTALRDLLNSAAVQNRGKIYNYALDMITPAQRDSVGASFHGEISVGSFRVRLWTYPQFYDAIDGTSTPYIDDKKAILLPENPRFVFSYAAVPLLLTTGASQQPDAYVIGNYPDDRAASHIFDIKSAGVAVPVAVDQIYTMKVVA